MPNNGQPVPAKDAFQRLLDGLQTLVREHLALARAEAKEDLRSMARDLLVGAAGVPALATGYLLLMLAVGFLLAQWLLPWAAFGVVALVNLAAGAALTLSCRAKLARRAPIASGTNQELRESKEWLASLSGATRPPAEAKLPEPSPFHPT